MSPYDDGWLLDTAFKWQPFVRKERVLNPLTGRDDGSHIISFHDADGHCTGSGVAVPIPRQKNKE